jgi:hypothetical protein
MSEEYKTEQSFKQHLIQSSPIMQFCPFASDCKGAENILGSRFLKVFQLFIRIHFYVCSIA